MKVEFNGKPIDKLRFSRNETAFCKFLKHIIKMRKFKYWMKLKLGACKWN